MQNLPKKSNLRSNSVSPMPNINVKRKLSYKPKTSIFDFIETANLPPAEFNAIVTNQQSLKCSNCSTTLKSEDLVVQCQSEHYFLESCFTKLNTKQCPVCAISMVLEDELEIVTLRSCSPAKLKPQRKLSVSFAVNVKQNSEEKRTMANSPESKPTR